MRVPVNLRSGELSFNMTPMIDVVFLLIIFFLVSSHLAKQEAQMELPLPIADTGETADESQTKRLTLNVLRDGSLVLAGRRIEEAQLAERLAAAKRTAGADVEVRIRGDRRVPYSSIAPVMLSCARAGIWNVTLSVLRTRDAR